MSKNSKKFILFGLSLIILCGILIPHTSMALEIIPCDGVDCGLTDLVILIKNVINAIIIIAIPFMTIILTWVGVLILTAQGNVSRIERAKKIAMNTAIGFVFILTAWLIVHTITAYFLEDEFRLFF